MKNFLGETAVRALSDFEKISYPSAKDEYWRFSNLKAWGGDALSKYFSEIEKNLENQRLPRIEKVSGKAEIFEISEAPAAFSETVKKFYAPSLDKFAVLQMCAPQNALLVSIPENETAEIEFNDAFDASCVSEGLLLNLSGVVFALGKNSKLKLFRKFSGVENSFSARRFAFELSEGAELELLTSSNSPENSPHFLDEKFSLSKNAKLVDAFLELGLCNSRAQRNFEFLGQGADADSRAFIRGASPECKSGDFTCDLRTMQHHVSPEASSNISVKSALFCETKLAFTGMIRVEENAQKTSSYQNCKTMLMSDFAKSETSPMLEILANDVQCSHGCSVSRPDPEQIFYMRSRGLSLIQARALKLSGFMKSVLERITIPCENLF